MSDSEYVSGMEDDSDIESDVSEIEENEPKLMDEYGAFDRANMTNLASLCTKIFDGAGPMSDVRKRIEQQVRDPSERFVAFMTAIMVSLNTENHLDITQKDGETMMSNHVYIKNIEKKNPTGYILGYLVTNGGGVINTELFDYIVNKILIKKNDETGEITGVIEDDSIKPADVIRYCRYWQTGFWKR
jgi:hypothetical protein